MKGTEVSMEKSKFIKQKVHMAYINIITELNFKHILSLIAAVDTISQVIRLVYRTLLHNRK